ncbi:MAG: ABC transporter substrate-binding protein [Oscillospiraceae bacterium]|nr:ABC transporter substrate-binding protein [Oscillospiraceae bacterium]
MKRIVSLVLTLMLTAGLLAACAADAPPAGESGSQAASQAGEQAASQPDASEGESAAPQSDAAFVGGWPYSTVPTGHYNMFVPGAIELKFYRELHQLPLATYRAATDEYVPMLASAWEISESGDTFNVTLREDAKWFTGEAFTSKDVWTTFMLYRLVNNPVWSYVESIEQVSDTEVSFKVSTPTPLILRYVLRKPMVDYATYGEYADRVQALLDEGKDSASDEWATLVNDFTLFRPETVNATGPYYLDPARVTESNVELLKNENSFLADTVKFAKVLVYNGDVPDLTPLVLNGEVDFLTHQFPAASMETFEGMGYATLQVPGVDGLAIYFNEAVKPLDQVEVRQALAYVIDRARVGELALPGVSRGTKYVSGLGDAMTEKWVDASGLTDYQVDHAKAAELLTAAGLTNDGSQWLKADGSPFTLSLQCPSTWSDGSTAASEVAAQLTAFGIKTTFDGIDGTMRQTNIDEGTFELAVSFFGTAQPHPMFAFETPLLLSNANSPKGLGYPMVQETERFGTVDLSTLIAASTAGWDEAAQKEAIVQIVGTVNETVPYLPLYTKYSKYIYSDGLRTGWNGDAALYENSAGDDSFAVIMILSGELAPL